ncbi:hypothetical protein O9992_30735 [Vibrio lentus]|nr:hypothetical protein [Vibrio lentus]
MPNKLVLNYIIVAVLRRWGMIFGERSVCELGNESLSDFASFPQVMAFWSASFVTNQPSPGCLPTQLSSQRLSSTYQMVKPGSNESVTHAAFDVG